MGHSLKKEKKKKKKSSLCWRQSQNKAENKTDMFGDDLTPFKAKGFFLFIEVVEYISMERMRLVFREGGCAVPVINNSGASPKPEPHQGPLSLVSNKSNMTVSKVHGFVTSAS